MCAAYIAAGLPPERFWTLTPRLYLVEIRGAADRLQREKRNQIEAAWLFAVLARTKKIPDLEKLLKPISKRSRKMERDELQTMFDIVAASWGAPKA
jgi:hypothetical protein